MSLTAVSRTRFHGNFVRKLYFNDVGFWFVIVRYFVLLSNYITLGLQKHEFLIKSNIRHFFVHSDYVWKLRHNYVASWLVNLLYIFLCQNYVKMLFLQRHIFHGVRITFFCGTFALCKEITLKLRFVIVRHCDVFSITSQLRYLFVRCTYVF